MNEVVGKCNMHEGSELCRLKIFNLVRGANPGGAPSQVIKNAQTKSAAK